MKLFLGIFGCLETIVIASWLGFLCTRQPDLPLWKRLKVSCDKVFKGFLLFYTLFSALLAGILAGIIKIIIYLSGSEL